MAITVATLFKVQTNIMAIQHLIFPFQTWMGALLDFFYKNSSTTEALTAWMSLIVIYSVAANAARNQPLRKLVTVKMWYISASVAIATIVHRDTWIICGLLLEGLVSGLFESWTFDRYLSNLLEPRPRGVRQTALLAFIIAGLLLIPRILSLLGLPTHLSLRIEADILTHAAVVLMNGLINEGLSLVHPSMFPSLSIYKMANGRNVLLKESVANLNPGSNSITQTPRKITVLFQMCLWSVVFLAWSTIVGVTNDIKYSLFSPAWHRVGVSRALFSVRRMQTVVSQGLYLLLLGKTEDFRSLLARIWDQADSLTVLTKMLDIALSVSFWGVSIVVLGYALMVVELIVTKIQELSNTLR